MRQTHKANSITSQQMVTMVNTLNESAYENRHLFAKTKDSPEFNEVMHATSVICAAMPSLVLNQSNPASFIIDLVKGAYISGILVGQRLDMPLFTVAE